MSILLISPSFEEGNDDSQLESLSDDAADETSENVEPIPGRPIPFSERNVITVVVMHVFELHTSDAADTHQQGAEKGDDEDADEMLPAVGLAKPLWEYCDNLFHCVVFFFGVNVCEKRSIPCDFISFLCEKWK